MPHHSAVDVAGGSGNALAPKALGRRAVLLGGAACALAAVSARQYGPQPVSSLMGDGPTVTKAERFAVQPDGVFSVRTSRPWVGLTFDDGPDPAYTPDVLDILDAFGVTATFFVVGANAAAYPELLTQAAAQNHEIGNHTQHHPDLNRLSAVGVAGEITSGQRSIVRQGVDPPALFRPPKGYTSSAVAHAARANGFRTVFWTHCLEHYLSVVGHAVAGARVAHDVRPGNVILAHDGGTITGTNIPHFSRRASVKALPQLLRGLQARGLQPVPMSLLLDSARERRGVPQ